MILLRGKQKAFLPLPDRFAYLFILFTSFSHDEFFYIILIHRIIYQTVEYD